MTDKNLTEPNIFKFATKELSQDAFLCWFISWANEKYKETNEELHDFAIKFINKLVGRNDLVFYKVEKQVLNIDILLTLKNKDEEYFVVIIEDKTSTCEHGEQIKRYKDKISWITNKNNIYLVYLKTGFTSQQERERLQSTYNDLSIYGHEEIHNFFESAPKHYLINQWFVKFEEKYDNFKECKNLFINKEYKKSFETNPDCFLDNLTTTIINDTDYKNAYWYIVDQGKTPHICLHDEYSSLIEEHIIHHGIYLMFSKNSFRFVIKQHICKWSAINNEAFVGANNRGLKDRIRIKDYNKLSNKLKEIKNTTRSNIINNCNWDNLLQDKENLMVVQKVYNYDSDFVKQITNESKSIDKLIKTIKNS